MTDHKQTKFITRHGLEVSFDIYKNVTGRRYVYDIAENEAGDPVRWVIQDNGQEELRAVQWEAFLNTQPAREFYNGFGSIKWAKLPDMFNGDEEACLEYIMSGGAEWASGKTDKQLWEMYDHFFKECACRYQTTGMKKSKFNKLSREDKVIALVDTYGMEAKRKANTEHSDLIARARAGHFHNLEPNPCGCIFYAEGAEEFLKANGLFKSRHEEDSDPEPDPTPPANSVTVDQEPENPGSAPGPDPIYEPVTETAISYDPEEELRLLNNNIRAAKYGPSFYTICLTHINRLLSDGCTTTPQQAQHIRGMKYLLQDADHKNYKNWDDGVRQYVHTQMVEFASRAVI